MTYQLKAVFFILRFATVGAAGDEPQDAVATLAKHAVVGKDLHDTSDQAKTSVHGKDTDSITSDGKNNAKSSAVTEDVFDHFADTNTVKTTDDVNTELDAKSQDEEDVDDGGEDDEDEEEDEDENDENTDLDENQEASLLQTSDDTEDEDAEHHETEDDEEIEDGEEEDEQDEDDEDEEDEEEDDDDDDEDGAEGEEDDDEDGDEGDESHDEQSVKGRDQGGKVKEIEAKKEVAKQNSQNTPTSVSEKGIVTVALTNRRDGRFPPISSPRLEML